ADVTITFSCEDLCELQQKNRDRRADRRKVRPGNKYGLLSHAHPHLTVRTLSDPWGDRLPGDPLSLASDLLIENDGHPSVHVFNFGHMPSFGTIAEFFWLPRDQPRVTPNVNPLGALILPSVAPRQDARARCPHALPSNGRDEIILVRVWSVTDPWL